MDENDTPNEQQPLDPAGATPADAATPLVPPLAPPPRKSSKAALLIGLVLALAIGGGAFVALKTAAAERPVAEVVPADVAAFAKVSLDPSTEQKRALRDIIEKLPESQRDSVESAIDDLLEQALRDQGVSYKNEVKPWLGDQIAFVASIAPPGGAGAGLPNVVVVVSTEDEAAARATLTKIARRDPGTFAYLIADGFAYLSNTDANITDLRRRAAERALSDNDSYKREHDRLGGDGLAFVYTDGAKLASGAAAGAPSFAFAGAAGTGAQSLRAESEGLVLNGHQKLPAGFKLGTGEPTLVTSVSSGLLGAASLFDLATLLEQALDAVSAAIPNDEDSPFSVVEGITSTLGVDLERDIIPWLHGEFSIVVGGISSSGLPDAGILIEPTDTAALTRTMNGLRANLAQVLGPLGLSVVPTSDGFIVDTGPVSLVVRRGKDRLVVATSRAYAGTLLARASAALANDVVYKSVLGGPADRTAGQLYLRVDRIRSFVETVVPAEARAEYERNVKPWLSLFDAFGARATITAGEVDFRAVLSLAG